MSEYDKKVYDLGYKFLLDFKEIDENILNLHLNQVDNISINSLEDIFFHFMGSLQNANMKANVIGGSINGGIKQLSSIVNFENIDKFENERKLLNEIFAELKPNSSKNVEEHINDPKSIWRKYAKSLFSVKNFLSQFSSYEDFKSWVDFFDEDDRARAALPMLLSNEIYGLGFALACDFLKEVGYVNFGKPDVHIKDIFLELNLSTNQNDYFVLKDIVRIAKNINKTPYNVDKLFWLIGSGNFYNSKIKIGSKKKEFIEHAKKELHEYF